MLEALKRNRIKLLGTLMVLVTLGVVGTLAPAPAANAQGCLPNCAPCPWCIFWSGGPVCLQPGQTTCYYGSHLICDCDNPDGNCNMDWIGTC